MIKSLLDTVGLRCCANSATISIIRGYERSILHAIKKTSFSTFSFFLSNQFRSTLILSGHKRSVDVATIAQGNTKFFSVLMLAWGMPVNSTSFCYVQSSESYLQMKVIHELAERTLCCID